MNRLSAVCLACVLMTVAPVTVYASDQDPVRANLDKAQKAFEAEKEKYRTAVGAWFDKREGVARGGGDKKAVDQVKAERQAFEDEGVLPKFAPVTLRSQLTTARSALLTAHKIAVQDYIKAKRDDDAAAVEKEMDGVYLESVSPEFPIPKKLYRLVNVQSGLSLDVADSAKGNAPLVQSARSEGSSQLWTVEYLDKERCKIINRNSGRIINVPGGRNQSGLDLLQFNNDQFSGNVQWIFQRQGKGFSLVSEHGLVIAVPDGDKKEGTQVVQLTRLKTNNEIWILVPVSAK